METIEKDSELFNNYSKIKKATKLCEIMVGGGKVSQCNEMYEEVMVGKINPDEYVDTMKGRFRTNKKLLRVLDSLNKDERG